ncbi:hypothetical protein [Lentilactobacillus hilgardii]|jgi:FAD synthase|uniref:Uncharacterized protein n=1 Tax=Lentilactobacillus hilgardii TaxID=1588 RepID=A0A6P1E4P6_LENHI|nr:hypothetical protein [Lentilactobacillus hilgardii]EEI72078.1 hypothetical protein HMPREF0496_0681 [Lentilactobacillus hilgardii ATCC 27305]MCT3392415.1 hypothetical protein [Lentilactobacillus hilgardii]QHB51060.1 hypothetical protein GQR93_01890 [Lentilactobacillus hilgardii]RRG11770.1 MAG: hypothetical protein DUD35_04515 [Lactobacillus sp.]
MDLKKIDEMIKAGDIMGANNLLGHRYETKGELIRAQINGRWIINLFDHQFKIPRAGDYTGFVKIADQERITSITVNRPGNQDSSAIVCVDLYDFNELPHRSTLTTSIEWIE